MTRFFVVVVLAGTRSEARERSSDRASERATVGFVGDGWDVLSEVSACILLLWLITQRS